MNYQFNQISKTNIDLNHLSSHGSQTFLFPPGHESFFLDPISQYIQHEQQIQQIEGKEQCEEEEEEEDEEEDEDECELERAENEIRKNSSEDSENMNKEVNSSILFSCKYDSCGKKFKAKKSLRDHLRIHTNDRPYICKELNCGKSFVQYSSLQKHIRTHKGERPYKCDYADCDLAFTQVSNLKRHMKIHLNDKPFECPQCFRKFTTTSNLKQHTITHDMNKERQRFKCQIDDCDKSYLYSSSLKKHEKEHILCNLLAAQQNRESLPSQIQEISPQNASNNQYYHNQDEMNEQEDNEQAAHYGLQNKILVENSIQKQLGEQQHQEYLKQLNFLQNQQTEQQIPVYSFNIQTNSMKDQLQNSNTPNQSNGCCSSKQKGFEEIEEQQSSCEQQIPQIPNIPSADEMIMLNSFFLNQHIALQHESHYDILFKGYLYHYNKKNGKIEIHEIQAHQEIKKGICQPLSEMTHNSHEELYQKISEIEYRYNDDFIFQSACSSLTCKCSQQQGEGCCGNSSGNQECKCSEIIQQSQPNNEGGCCGTKSTTPFSNSESGCCGTKSTSQKDKETSCCGGKKIKNSNDISSPSNKQTQQSCCSKKENDKVVLQTNNNNDNIKDEECCCSINGIKVECLCSNGCNESCPSCSMSCKCKKNKNQNRDTIFTQPKKDSLQFYQEENPPSSGTQRKCICSETRDLKHIHGPNCGHIPVFHNGHLDYIVENQLHHPHGNHCDFHGTVSVLEKTFNI